ncbi:MAG: gliding motility-associated C-terminal domain-containing protein [Chitinophagales bacterium]
MSLLALVLMSFLPLSFPSNMVLMEEICDNGIDDDNDDLVDLNDPDCVCSLIEPLSLIPNPSFEEKECCPWEEAMLHCASDWIQASLLTTDYIHTCDWMGWDGVLGWDDFPVPIPFPDGEAVVGFRDGWYPPGQSYPDWKEYAGACLLSPLESGVPYRIKFDLGFVSKEFSPPINMSFFGTADCTHLPFGQNDPLLGCPIREPNWVKLGSVEVSGGAGGKWVNSFIEVTPTQNIAAIAIGPDCPHGQESNTFYYLDNLILAELKSFELDIAEVSHPCKDDYALEVTRNPFLTYQWYKDGVALIGETAAKLTQMYGEGDYQVSVKEGSACRVSAKHLFVVPIISRTASETICKEETYSFGNQILTEAGIYEETFKSKENCDSTVTLQLDILGLEPDTLTAKIFEGRVYEINGQSLATKGNHLITLTSSKGCDSLLLLQLEYYKIAIPTVFSPNNDGINDLFSIAVEDELFESLELSIFDRWGNKLHECNHWDGYYDFRPVDLGVYVYRLRISTKDGNEKLLSGWLTVVR